MPLSLFSCDSATRPGAVQYLTCEVWSVGVAVHARRSTTFRAVMRLGLSPSRKATSFCLCAIGWGMQAFRSKACALLSMTCEMSWAWLCKLEQGTADFVPRRHQSQTLEAQLKTTRFFRCGPE
jgi:hypothetical protein